MEGFHYVDLFATKGIEYLFVIAFLMAFLVFWGFLGRSGRTARRLATVQEAGPAGAPWFELRRGLFYHQGHSWVMPEGEDLVRVGIDDFAQKLLGRPSSVSTPAVGGRIEQGERGWKLEVGSKLIEMLSPVDGEVVEINEEVLRAPDLINTDPYGKGWLLKVRVPKMRRNLRNLLPDGLARAWMEETVDALRRRMATDSGPALQDGGAPVVGMGPNLSPENWDEIAAEFLLTK